MKVFIINLEKSVGRRRKVAERLDKLGVSYEFVPGVYGQDVDRSDWPDNEKLSTGEVGCAVAHIQIYKRMVDESIDSALILEDDIKFAPGFPAVLKALPERMKDGTCVLLHAMFTHAHTLTLEEELVPGHYWGTLREVIGGVGSAGAYAISLGTAKRMWEVRQKNLSFTADSWVNYMRNGAIDQLDVIHPYPVLPAFEPSTIGYSGMGTTSLRNVPPLSWYLRWKRERIWAEKQTLLTINKDELATDA